MKKLFLYLGLLAMVAFSCNRGDDGPVPQLDSGKVQMRFANMAGNQPLKFHTDWYQNAHGDSFNVTLFAYYISNIRFNRADGSGAYVQPNSYYLIDGYTRPTTLDFAIDSVPSGTYNSITLTIGVDSTRNVSGAQTGALDLIWGYFWGWNSGYIFMKFDGQTSKSPADAKDLEYHIGGFRSPYNTIRTVTLPLPNSIQIARGKKAVIDVEADILKVFDTPHQMDFTRLQKIHDPGPEAAMVADNYANMLRIRAAAVQ